MTWKYSIAHYWQYGKMLVYFDVYLEHYLLIFIFISELLSYLIVEPKFSPLAGSSRPGSSLSGQLRRQWWRRDSVWQPPGRQWVIWIRRRQHGVIWGSRGWGWAWTKPLQHIYIDREGAQLFLTVLHRWRAADGHGGGEESTDQLQNQCQLHHWDL